MAVLTNMQRVNLGPLTTTFSAPAACSTPAGRAGNFPVAWQAQACDITQGPSDTTSCWPEATAGVLSPEAPFIGWGFYSPGLICPAGHTSACSATASGASGWDIQYGLRGGETAVGCCPTGYTCTNYNGQTCRLVVTSTTISTLSCVTGSISASNPVVTRTLPVNSLSLSRLTIFAPMIQLNFQSTDLPSSTTSTPVSTPIETSTEGPITSPSNDGMSPGAIAGIAIACVLIAIGLSVFAFLMWRRRRRMGTQLEEQEQIHTYGYVQEMDGKNWKPLLPTEEHELPGQSHVYEIGASDVHELPAQRWSQYPDR